MNGYRGKGEGRKMSASSSGDGGGGGDGRYSLHCSISGVHQSVSRHITVSLTNTYTHGLTLAI